MGARYVLRFDDIAPNMHWDNFRRIVRILDSCDVRALIGVIPDNRAESARERASPKDLQSLEGRHRVAPPFRRRQLGRLARATADAKRVLFVCKGNICRSPFAERYARPEDGSSLRVRSRGYYPIPGRTSPRAAVVAARDFEIDLESHRSGVLDAADIAWADLIVVFDEENFRTVREAHPDALGKLYRLTPGRAIADPFGQDVEVFRRTYGRIAEGVETLLSSRASSRSR